MTLIDEHLTHCRHLGLSDVTIAERARVLRQADRHLPHGLDKANRNELQEWLGRGLAPATRRCYRTHLCQFFAWATDPDDPWLTHDPAHRLARVRVPRGLPHPATLDELETALGRLADPWRRAILLAAYAGLRCGDLAELHRGDVTPETIRIRVGKGGVAAAIPPHPLVWAEVEPLPDGLVIPLSPGRMPRRRKLSRYLWWHLHRIGLTHLSAHSFRHFFGTELYRATQDLRVVQELMRHASPATTAVYTQIADRERRLAVRALPAVA